MTWTNNRLSEELQTVTPSILGRFKSKYVHHNWPMLYHFILLLALYAVWFWHWCSHHLHLENIIKYYLKKKLFLMSSRTWVGSQFLSWSCEPLYNRVRRSPQLSGVFWYFLAHRFSFTTCNFTVSVHAHCSDLHCFQQGQAADSNPKAVKTYSALYLWILRALRGDLEMANSATNN